MAPKTENFLVKHINAFISKLTLGSDTLDPKIYKLVWLLITITFLGLLVPAALGNFWGIFDSMIDFVLEAKDRVLSVIDLIPGVDFTSEVVVPEVIEVEPTSDIPQ